LIHFVAAGFTVFHCHAFQAGVLVDVVLLPVFGEDGIETGPDDAISERFGIGFDFAGGIIGTWGVWFVVFGLLDFGGEVRFAFEGAELVDTDTESSGDGGLERHLVSLLVGWCYT